MHNHLVTFAVVVAAPTADIAEREINDTENVLACWVDEDSREESGAGEEFEARYTAYARVLVQSSRADYDLRDAEGFTIGSDADGFRSSRPVHVEYEGGGRVRVRRASGAGPSGV